MLSIFTSTMVFSMDHQSTSNDQLKPVMTTGLVKYWPVDCQPCCLRQVLVYIKRNITVFFLPLMMNEQHVYKQCRMGNSLETLWWQTAVVVLSLQLSMNLLFHHHLTSLSLLLFSFLQLKTKHKPGLQIGHSHEKERRFLQHANNTVCVVCMLKK